MKLLFFPVFSNSNALTDHFFRLHWYLYPFRNEISEVVLLRKSDAIEVGAVPGFLDKDVSQLVGDIPISLITVTDDNHLKEYIESADAIFRWAVDPEQPNAPDPKLKNKTTINIDHEQLRGAGSYYLMFSKQFKGLQEAYLERSRKIFDRICQRSSSNIGYIFGTGPGLAEAKRYDFSDGISIACNSMVRNYELLDRLKPPLIVVADPIFHAGPSSYASAFRKDLIRALDRYESDLIVPMRDYHIYQQHLPERFSDRIAALPFETAPSPNLDLTQSFHVTSTANVLTLFLLPLAATFFEDINIFGCDGRPLKANSYFWSHDKASQFNDEMVDIKQAHPGFFNIDYDDYYQTHCETLASWINAAEQLGKRITNHTPSHIPSLASRSVDGVKRFDEPDMEKTYTELISIDPDALDNFGHFLSYDGRLAEEAKRRGLKFSIMGNKDFDEDTNTLVWPFHKTFSSHSWTIGNRPKGPALEELAKFEFEFREALMQNPRSADSRAMLYFYCGSLDHVKIIHDVLAEFDFVDANVNLFFTSFIEYKSAAFRKKWASFLKEISSSDRISLTAPTPQFQKGLYEATGVMLPVAPHPSATFSDDEAEYHSQTALTPASDPMTVLFPGGMLADKGFDLTAACVNLLKDVPENLQCIVRARAGRRPDPAMQRALESIESQRAIVSKEDMNDEAFAQFLSGADIVVLPYRASGFSERTSGLLIDTMLLGRPVVVLNGTWLSDVVDKGGFGVVAKDSTDDLAAAIRRIAKAYDTYKDNITEARQNYLKENSWAALIDMVLTPALNTRLANASFDVSSVTPITEIPDLIEYERDDHAHVDETNVVAHLLSRHKGREHTLIDVGAHFGTSSSYFHKLGWTIHCFEPDANNRQKLLGRYRNAENVTIDTRAVSDKPAHGASFFSSEESTGISGLHAFRPSHTKDSCVDVTTITDIIAERNIQKIDFLKIDVEGFDFSVLKGVPWDFMKPDVIECEFEDAKTVPLGHTWRDIANYLNDRGYTVYICEWHPIIRYGIRHEWRRVLPFPSVDISSTAWGNFLAFKQDPGYGAVSAAFEALTKRYQAPTQATTLSQPARAQTPKAPTHAAAVSQAEKVQTPEVKKTPVPPKHPRLINASVGEKIRKKSPRIFNALLFVRSAARGLWNRRIWTAPLIFAIASIAAAGLLPALASYRIAIWGFAAFATAIFAILYIGLRTYQHIKTLANETARLHIDLGKLRIDASKLRIDLGKTADAQTQALLDQSVRAQGQNIRELNVRLEVESAENRTLKSALNESVTSFKSGIAEARSTSEIAEKSLKENIVSLTQKLKAVDGRLQTDLGSQIASTNRLRERIVAGERQIGGIRYPNAPSCIVLFGHHKCGSRFFRNEIFLQIAAMVGAQVRKYEISNPPFHYSRMDDLDLCNIDFKKFGESGRDVVLFANATERSLDKIKKTAPDWKGVRILRDPRQVLVSNYFHHKGDHHTELNGWVWTQLKNDQPILRELPEEAGLLYELDNISKQVIEDQVLCPFDDDRILTIKMEDFSKSPKEYLTRIAAFLEVPDIAGIDFTRTSANTHSGPWKDRFTPKVHEIFKTRYGQALIDMGYAEDFNW